MRKFLGADQAQFRISALAHDGDMLGQGKCHNAIRHHPDRVEPLLQRRLGSSAAMLRFGAVRSGSNTATRETTPGSGDGNYWF